MSPVASNITEPPKTAAESIGSKKFSFEFYRGSHLKVSEKLWTWTSEQCWSCALWNSGQSWKWSKCILSDEMDGHQSLVVQGWLWRNQWNNPLIESKFYGIIRRWQKVSEEMPSWRRACCPSLSASWSPWGSQMCSTRSLYHEAMTHFGPKITGTSQPWTETSETLNQHDSVLLWNCLKHLSHWQTVISIDPLSGPWRWITQQVLTLQSIPSIKYK